MLTRRAWLGLTASGLALTLTGRRASALALIGTGEKVIVYKRASCECCQLWADYMTANGFTVDARDLPDDKLDGVKRKLRVPADVASCHTAVVGGYVVEGHVPADLVQRMLRERPAIAGIATPGMPMGSPGMPGTPEPYRIISFTRDGKQTLYANR